MLPTYDEQLDEALYPLFIEQRTAGTPISGPLLQEKAKHFQRQLHVENANGETFKVSTGWLEKFKNCHSNLAGLEISFFRQAPTGDWPFFFSRQIGKCGRQIVSIKVFLCSKTQTKNFGHNFSFKNQNEGNAFGAAMVVFLPKNKIKYKHADYLYTYLHWKSTTKESNADHNDIHCFVWLSSFLSQLCTFSCTLYLLEKKCTRRKKCCLVLCCMSRTIFLLRSVKTIEGSPCFSHQANTVQHLSFQCQNLCKCNVECFSLD